MVCLLLLFSPKGIFSFVQIKKKTKQLLTRASNALAALVVIIVIPSHHLIHLGVIFLSGLCMCGGLV